MATNTYVALDRVTLGSNTAQVTFSSISGAYTDLLLVINGGVTTQGPVNVQVNNDTASNYSYTRLYGNGTTATSDRFTSEPSFDVGFFPNSLDNNAFVHFMNYSNTTTNKTILNRWNSTGFTAAAVGLWRSTAAITSIKLFNASPYNLKEGSTFSLYGIKADDNAYTAKATGGTITSDVGYIYHTFTSSGTFTPTQSISADVLVVAGGGSGGTNFGGAGGAGGLFYSAANSLTSTGYTVTVGAGGAVQNTDNVIANQGTNSQFGSLTAAVGGGAGGGATIAGGNGGSGGGAGGSGTARSGGTATSGQGYDGGSNLSDGAGAGGGGAAAVGSNTTPPNTGGAGGAGSSTYSVWGLATSTGQNVSSTYYYAGGGGGGGRNSGQQGAAGNGGGGTGGAGSTQATAGTANTGGGGGGGTVNSGKGGAGGSGIVIVRYAK